MFCLANIHFCKLELRGEFLVRCGSSPDQRLQQLCRFIDLVLSNIELGQRDLIVENIATRFDASFEFRPGCIRPFDEVQEANQIKASLAIGRIGFGPCAELLLCFIELPLRDQELDQLRLIARFFGIE